MRSKLRSDYIKKLHLFRLYVKKNNRFGTFLFFLIRLPRNKYESYIYYISDIQKP